MAQHKTLRHFYFEGFVLATEIHHCTPFMVNGNRWVFLATWEAVSGAQSEQL